MHIIRVSGKIRSTSDPHLDLDCALFTRIAGTGARRRSCRGEGVRSPVRWPESWRWPRAPVGAAASAAEDARRSRARLAGLEARRPDLRDGAARDSGAGARLGEEGGARRRADLGRGAPPGPGRAGAAVMWARGGGEWGRDTWRRGWNRTRPAPADVVRRAEEDRG